MPPSTIARVTCCALAGECSMSAVPGQDLIGSNLDAPSATSPTTSTGGSTNAAMSNDQTDWTSDHPREGTPLSRHLTKNQCRVGRAHCCARQPAGPTRPGEQRVQP